MSATIYRYEVHARLRSVITWSLGLMSLIVLFFAMFPVFADQAALMNEMMARFPAELREAFGMGQTDFATVLGYYSFIFLFVQLCLAIQASMVGFGLVSVEEAELTADFLLTRPVSRGQVLTSKLLAAATGLALTDMVVWASTLVAILLFGGGREVAWGTLVLLLFSVVIFQAFFVGVGLVISLLVKRVRNVTPYGLGLGFGAYVLNAFSGVFGEIALELITPFKHLDAAYILAHGAYNTPLVLLNVAITVVAVAASYVLYLRRDIPAIS